MMKRLMILASFTLALVPIAQASSCRAYNAANKGSQAGYDIAKKAADSWSQHEDQVSESLGECLGDISTTLVMPQFPSLSSILGKIEQEVCQAAQSEINQYVPSTIDPWSDFDTDIPDINVSATRHIPERTEVLNLQQMPSTTSTPDDDFSGISLN
ncbi:hypothetical protein WAB73_003250 [Salmonella enterica subsp. enterica]